LALLIIKEAADSTARFKLSTKYKGVAMWDDEEGEWNVVMDLEWPKSKIPGAAAEDLTDIRGACIMNEAILRWRHRPVIKKTPAGESGDSGGKLRHKEKRAHPRP
jgi:hypothetical protein